MNYYDYVYDTFQTMPFEYLTNSNSSFCTLLSNKQNINIIQQYFTFGIHPEENEEFHEWCSTGEAAMLSLDNGKIPDYFIDNSLFSLSNANKFKRSNDTQKYVKVFFDYDCIYFSGEKITIYLNNNVEKEFDIPRTKDDWFNITVLEPSFKLGYEELDIVLKIFQLIPNCHSAELYPDSWIYKKDVDN